MNASSTSRLEVSAQSTSEDNPPIEHNVFQNRKSWLLALYLVVPACVLFVLIDQLLLNGQIRSLMPREPAEWAFWAIFFNLPHIFSSFITLADREYIGVYKKELTKSLFAIGLIIGLLAFGLSYLSTQRAYQLELVFFTFFATYTMYHVMSQQYGLALMMMRSPANRVFQLWRWGSIMATAILYGLVFMRDYIDTVYLFNIYLLDLLFYVCGALVVISTVFGFQVSKKSQTKQGRNYVYSNIAMVISCYFCLLMKYPAFVIVMPRVIHDITAFMIYCGHDQNRNAKEYKNFIHGLFSFLKIPPKYLNPILAISVAALADHYSGYDVLAMILIGCGLFHYYMEGIIWKRDAIHRKSLKFI